MSYSNESDYTDDHGKKLHRDLQEALGVPSHYTNDECIERVRQLMLALWKINDIRNNIIGTQTVNWSEHVYPLVSALKEVGMKGLEYPDAREQAGNLVQQRDGALAAVKGLQDVIDALKRENDRLRTGTMIEGDYAMSDEPHPEARPTPDEKKHEIGIAFINTAGVKKLETYR